jgi:hypothetical protein
MWMMDRDLADRRGYHSGGGLLRRSRRNCLEHSDFSAMYRNPEMLELRRRLMKRRRMLELRRRLMRRRRMMKRRRMLELRRRMLLGECYI